MEPIVTLVIFLILVVFFKKPIRRIARHTDTIVAVNINESETELIERSEDAYNELIETCGENFHTPEEIYDLMHHKTRKTAKA